MASRKEVHVNDQQQRRPAYVPPEVKSLTEEAIVEELGAIHTQFPPSASPIGP